MRSVFLASALVAAASAQSTVIQILAQPANLAPGQPEPFIHGYFLGSIVNADSVATTVSLNCLSGMDPICPLPGPLTVVNGPSTYGVTGTLPVTADGIVSTVYLNEACAIQGTTAGSCRVTASVTVSIEGQVISTGTTSVMTLTSGDIAYEPLTITAGANKLSNASSGSKGAGVSIPVQTATPLAAAAAAAAFAFAGLL
jgi:hypothetical protein